MLYDEFDSYKKFAVKVIDIFGNATMKVIGGKYMKKIFQNHQLLKYFFIPLKMGVRKLK